MKLKYITTMILTLAFGGSAHAQVYAPNYGPNSGGSVSLGNATMPQSSASNTQVVYVSNSLIKGSQYFTFDDSTSFLTANGPGTNGGFRAGRGSISLPSYSFQNDTNTGMWNVTGDQIGLTTNGTTRFLVTNGYTASAVSLGVGGTSTPNATLDVSGTLKIGPCSTTQACAASDVGNLCRRVSNNTLYQCDGTGSFSPVQYGTKVSNTGLN